MSIDGQIESITKNIAYYGLIWWNYITDKASFSKEIAFRVLGAVKGVFEEDYWIFLNGHDIPISTKGMDISRTENALIYDRSANHFTGKSQKTTLSIG